MSEKSYIPSGVFLVCDKGVLPTPLTVTSALTVDILGSNVATDLDKAPLVNIKPFGVCTVTRTPCMPAPTPLGWSPVKDDVVIQGAHPLLEDSQLRCTMGGCIRVFMSMSAAMLGARGSLNEAVNAVVDGAIKDVGDAVTRQFDKADDYFKQWWPPLGDVAREELGKVEGALEGVGGIVTGLWELHKMGRELELKVSNAVVHAIDHPEETAAAVKQAAQRGWEAVQDGDNWLRAADLASNAVPGVLEVKGAIWLSDAANREKAWNVTKAAYAKASAYLDNPRNRGKFKGRVAFEVAFAVLTGGMGEAAHVSKLSKTGELLNVGEKLVDGVTVGKVVTGTEKVGAEVLAREGVEQAAAKELQTVKGASKGCRTCEAEPVDVATGDMLFDAVDLDLPGPVPFVWERTWYSTSQRQGPLGHGWHHAYDQALWQDPTGHVYLRLADGRLATFEPLSAENNFCAYHRGEQLELRRAEAGYAVYAVRERLTYRFAALAQGPQAATEAMHCLLAIEDGHGHALRFAYTDQGHLRGITDSVGRAIGVRTDAHGRILALDLPHANGSPGTFAAMQYTYDEQGNMTAAIDAEGHAMRAVYQEGHLITSRTFRNGISFYFEYDAQRRCTRTWGDGNYLNRRFHYEPGYSLVLTDEPAVRQEFYHQAGLVTLHMDGVGSVRKWHYNAHGELELARDPLGQTTLYDYDARGNQVGVTYPDGARVQTRYEAQGRPVQGTDATGGRWQWQYDEQGQLTARTDPTGATTHYAYDAQGRLREVLDALGHATRLGYDAQHNLAHVVTADDQITSRSYDALGRLVTLTDALGHAQQRRYDRRGQLVAVREPDGTLRTLAYDGEGNLVRLADGQQGEVTCEYTCINRLVRRRQAGQEVRFDYDRDGEMVGLVNEHGHAYRFTLDAAGRVVEEVGFDGLTRQYVRDAAGRVTQVRRPAGRTTDYAYDAAGRVTRVAHSDGTFQQYGYDAAGALRQAATATSTVRLERDALGRVLTETQGTHTVTQRYDARGQRTALHSSLGAALAWTHDAQGRVTTLQTETGWRAALAYDARGLEVQRTFNGVRTHWAYDAAGRPQQQHVVSGGSGSSQAERRRRYQWQGADQLTQLEDSLHGATRFTYDAWGTWQEPRTLTARRSYASPMPWATCFARPSARTAATARAGSCARPTAHATNTTRKGI